MGEVRPRARDALAHGGGRRRGHPRRPLLVHRGDGGGQGAGGGAPLRALRRACERPPGGVRASGGGATEIEEARRLSESGIGFRSHNAEFCEGLRRLVRGL